MFTYYRCENIKITKESYSSVLHKYANTYTNAQVYVTLCLCMFTILLFINSQSTWAQNKKAYIIFDEVVATLHLSRIS